MPVWFLLAAGGGAVNASALLACRTFVSHVTGCLTRFAIDYASFRLLIDYAAVVFAFMLGAITSFWFLDARRLKKKTPRVATPLALVAIVLTIVAFMGRGGHFGPFGQTVETNGDFVLLGLLAFAMGLQNACVAITSGMAVRTTHMTGPLTDLSIGVGALLTDVPRSVRRMAKRTVALRITKVVGFVTGGMVAAVIAPHVEYGVFLFPAAVTAVGARLLHMSVASAKSRAAATDVIPESVNSVRTP